MAYFVQSQRFILCEMIKESKLDVDVLVNVLKSREFEPDWFSMYLPHGTSVCHLSAVM